MFVAMPRTLQPFARERLTIGNTVVPLTASVYGNTSVATQDDRFPARAAFVTVETDSIRVTLEGTDPVSGSKGHVFKADDAFWLDNPANIRGFKAIRETTDAAIEVTYYR